MRLILTFILLTSTAIPALARDQAREFGSGWHKGRPQRSAPVPTTQSLAAPVPLVTSTSSNRVTLQWANITNETGYLVERRLYGTQSFGEIAKTTADNTTYTDILTSTDTYEYRVRAYQSTGTMSYSPYTDIAYSTTSCQ